MERMQREETPWLGVYEGMRIRIRPISFLGQPERVMEWIQREETPRFGVSEGIRPRISIKRIRPIPFLGQPERVMERMQKEETSRLGVSEGIRTFKKEFARILSSDNPKGLWKGYQDKKPLGWGSPDAMNMDHLNLVSTRKKKKKKRDKEIERSKSDI
jgi:hypothetical protein